MKMFNNGLVMLTIDERNLDERSSKDYKEFLEKTKDGLL
jgi:hypothetical protein